eukprot:TRINITY_DN8523_c0_g1_i1.p1 TRINITY_DN8523_c0_g1~~TRINITY_DN8523_c0_g1_i1.p1  ORF type:complete len:228 (-),score=42.27 TRINITY_DN8523_c0_g1_i1:20-703(-)
MTDSAFKGVVYKRDPTQELTFLGAQKNLKEIKNLFPLLQDLDTKIFRRILQFVLEYIKGTEITDQHWSKLQQATELKPQNLTTIYSGLYYILRNAIKNRVEVATFQTDLTEKLKVPESYVKDLTAAYTNSLPLIEKSSLEKRIKYPSVVDLNWRVDVTITTSTSLRVFKPAILAQMTTTDGKIRTFEMSPDQFHKLRYNVARVLKEIDNVEKLPTLKIDKKLSLIHI